MRTHLAVFAPDVIEKIFSGRKRIESRFSINKIAPFGQISPGDLVYIKPAGKDPVGQFVVGKVVSFEGLDDLDWQIIRTKWGKGLCLDERYLQEKQTARFATIVFMRKIEQFIVSPIKIKKNDQRGWMILS